MLYQDKGLFTLHGKDFFFSQDRSGATLHRQTVSF